MSNPSLQISRDADRALEEFSDEFREALVLGEFESWAEMFGHVRDTDVLKTTFPIPIDAAGYKEFKGDMKYRSLYHRALTMTTKNWQDGIEEFAAVIEAPDFIDWGGAPGRMAVEWKRQPQILVADMLALSGLDGPILDFYRDVDSGTASTRRLFASDHPFNVLMPSLGDFDNTMDTTIAKIEDGTFFGDANEKFREIKGPNGRPLGLRFGGGNNLVPVSRENVFKKFLENDTLVRAVINPGDGKTVAAIPQNNIWNKTVGYTVSDELVDQDHFYALAGGKPGLWPWVIQRGSAPEEFIFDKSSERYKNTLKVALSMVGKMNVAGCLPHGIIRVRITG